MHASLPSYSQIKAKYKKGQPLSPLEIGRGLVFLLIDELAEIHEIAARNEQDAQGKADQSRGGAPNAYAKPNEHGETGLDRGKFNFEMLQDLTGQSKHYIEAYAMVYYTTIMVCCIRCLVHERKYWLEILAKNIDQSIVAGEIRRQNTLIDKGISETNDTNIQNLLKALKATQLEQIAPREEHTSYRNMSRMILLQLSAIYTFAEIIGEVWEIPELTCLFYGTPQMNAAASLGSNYDEWLQAALFDVNIALFSEKKLKPKKLTLDEIQIQPKNIAKVRALLEGRYLDISRTKAFIEALKEGISLTVSGSQNDA